MKKFHLNPKKLVYIDDQEKNLFPAKKLGMKTILFKSKSHLARELKKV